MTSIPFPNPHGADSKPKRNKQNNRMKSTRKLNCKRLNGYLTATVGTSLLAAVQSDAAIVTIDLGLTGFDILGSNGNLAPNTFAFAYDFPIAGEGALYLANYSIAKGLVGIQGLMFAATSTANPTNFPNGAVIDNNVTFSGEPRYHLFNLLTYYAPVFAAGSFMGFKTKGGNYGWLEVTWNGTDTFEIKSGAFEDQVGVGIPAGFGASPSAIPEPANILSTMGLLASGLLIRRRKLVARDMLQ